MSFSRFLDALHQEFDGGYMDSMYKLTKQIDALTYNSRAVLNALVRSCVASGSSSGYTVKRYGKELTLNRADIYRLYDFYQTWANGSAGYEPFTSDPDEFADIVAKADAKWKGDSLVKNAIITHSKIMYLVSTNVNNDSGDYWLGLIRDASSPKLITNSAPIPLNLRTPLYDADLSTKSFSQYETYLFPAGYNKISITGMPGDNEDHVGGGKSWVWDIDEKFEVTAPRIRFGYYTDTVRRLQNYGSTKYSMSFGYDTYALGERSVAMGGINNISAYVNSGTVGGNALLATGSNSFIGGGTGNITVGDSTFASGVNTDAVARASFAANLSTIAGDYAYDFTIEEPEDAGTTTTDCEAIKDTTTGICTTTGSTESITSGEGRNTVRISYRNILASGMYDLNIAKGDVVVIYAQTRKDNGRTYAPTDTQGYAFRPLELTVANVTRENENYNADYLVMLDGNIPRGETYESLWVNGGKIARARVTLRDMDYSGRLLGSSIRIPGNASTALNFNTYTPGINQTAVGQMNVGNRDAKFMVGIGSSYVGNNAFRRNGFVVAQPYSYMQTATQDTMVGVSDVARVDNTIRDYDGNFIAKGAWLSNYGERAYAVGGSRGRFASYVVANSLTSMMSVHNTAPGGDFSRLRITRSGSHYISNYHDVTVCLESRAGSVVINAGGYINAQNAYDVLLAQGPLRANEGRAVAIYSENGMELRNTNENRVLSIHNSGYISATFKGLLLHGNTFSTLTATENSRSFWVYHNSENRYGTPFLLNGYGVDYPNVIAHSGFYYGQNDWHPGATPSAGRINLPNRARGVWEIHQGRGMHIINSAVAYVNSQQQPGFDISCLILPGQVKADEIVDPPHPKVINSFIYGTGNNGVLPSETYLAEELAYLSDVEKVKTSAYVTTITRDNIAFIGYRNYNVTELSKQYPATDDSNYSFYPSGSGIDTGAGTDSSFTGMVDFNRLSCPVFYFGSTICRAFIRSPLDSPNGIMFKKFGPIYAGNLVIRPTGNSTSVNTTEYAVVVKQSPMWNLGSSGSLVLAGTGAYGVSVTCTITNEVQKNVSLGSLASMSFGASYIFLFVITMPSSTPTVDIPITLTGITHN